MSGFLGKDGGITQLIGDVTTTEGEGVVASTVEQLQGRDVSNSSPNDGDVLTWDAANNQWAPAVGGGGGGGSGITELTQDVLAGSGSGSQAATVVGLQGNPVDNAVPNNNDLLLWNGSIWIPSGAYYWRTTPDAHDLGVWRMNESNNTFANSGADGTLALTVSGTISYSDDGGLGTGVYVNGGNSSYLASVDTTKCQPSSLTVWSWIRVRAPNAQYPLAIAKLNGVIGAPWNPPYFDYVIELYPSGSGGTWLVSANINGSLVSVDNIGSGNRFSIVTDKVYLLALTYDGTTLKAYMDGVLAGSANAPGTISYGGGPIVRGANPNSSFYGLDGWLGECRVRDQVLTAAELSEIYRRHIGLWP